MSAPRRALLDTSVIIDLDRLDLGEYATVEPFVSAVSVAELAYGLNTADPIERLARTERYYAVLDQFEVLTFDIQAAKLYGIMTELVRQSGRNPRPRRMDLQIAATAAAHSLTLLTRNPKDFAALDRLVTVIGL